MKKVCLLLIISIFFCLIAAGCVANVTQEPLQSESPTPNLVEETGFEYKLSPTSATVTKYVGNERNVSVPGEIAGLPVETIGKNCFTGTAVETIIVPSSVKYLGAEFAKNATALSCIIFEDESRILSIGENTISGTLIESSLTDENPIYSVGKVLVRVKSDYKEAIIIPAGITRMAVGAFYGSEATSIEFNASFEQIIPSEILPLENIEYIAVKSKLALFEDGEMFTGNDKILICYPETNAEAYALKYGYCYSVADESNVWEYSELDGEIKIEKYNGSSLSVKIPSEINGKKVSALGTNVFENKAIVHLYIPSTVERIEASFAEDNNELESITFEKEESIVFIGKNAFVNTKFENVTNNIDGLCVINGILTRCFDAESAVVPSYVEKIAAGAFLSTVKEIRFEEGCISFDDGLLDGCLALEKLYAPNSVALISEGAFDGKKDVVIYCDAVAATAEYAKEKGYNCVTEYFWTYRLNEENKTAYLEKYIGKQEKVKAPRDIDGYTVIGISSIRNSTIKSLYIPNTVKRIDESFAYGLTELENVEFEDEYAIEYIGAQAFFGTLYEKNAGNGGLLVIGKTVSSYTGDGEVIIPDEAEAIAEMAFLNSSAERVILSENVKSIGAWAFRSSHNLRYVYIDDAVTAIGNNAFDDCESVTVYCHKGSYAEKYAKQNGIQYEIIDYSEWSFSETENGIVLNGYNGTKEKVTVPDKILGKNVTAIGSDCFGGTLVKEIIIPSTIIGIETGAFSAAWSLESVVYEDIDRIRTIGNNVFEGTPYFTSLTTDNGFTVINGMLVKCDATGDVVIPADVTTILGGAFAQASGIKSIRVNEACGEINDSVFAELTELESIYIPDSTTKIGIRILGENDTAVILCHNNSAALRYALAEGYEVSQIEYEYEYVLNNTGITLTEYFGSDKYVSVPSVIDGKKVTVIGEGCFADSSIQKVFISENIESIMKNAFPATLCEAALANGCRLNYVAENAFQQSFFENNIDKNGNTVLCGILLKSFAENNIQIDSEIKSVAGGAFRGRKIKSISVNGNITLCDNSFSGISSVDWIYISEEVTSIGKYIFSETSTVIKCKSGSVIQKYATDNGLSFELTDADSFGWQYDISDAGVTLIKYVGNGTEVIIPDTVSGKNVIEIGASCFENSSIKTVFVPATVKKIGNRAFASTHSLEKITFADEKSIESVGERILYDSLLLSFITDDEGFASVNGILISYSGKSECIVKKGIKRIAGYAFGRNVTSVKLNNVCVAIDNNAFADALSLEEITVPDSVTQFGEDIFGGNLVRIICFEGSEAERYATDNYLYCQITENSYSFKIDASGNAVLAGYNGNETDIELPMMYANKAVTKIDDNCFKDSDITSVYIPETVTEIGNNAFYRASLLAVVEFENESTIEYIGNGAFKETLFENVTGVDETNTVMINGILIRHYGNGSIELSGNTVGIASRAFYDKADVVSVTINEGCEWIDAEAFCMLPGLERVFIPHSVNLIDDTAFRGSETKLTLFCYSGTYAEQYAQANNLACIIIE